MNLHILSPGLQTTVQDRGRFGYQSAGIGVSGAMDPDAYADANYLVGNHRGEAVLEMTLLGPSIQFDNDCVCALTGADMRATLDGEPVARYKPFCIAEGQVLTTLKKLAEQGTSIIYVGHQIEKMKQLCNTICFIRNGQLIRS